MTDFPEPTAKRFLVTQEAILSAWVKQAHVASIVAEAEKLYRGKPGYEKSLEGYVIEQLYREQPQLEGFTVGGQEIEVKTGCQTPKGAAADFLVGFAAGPFAFTAPVNIKTGRGGVSVQNLARCATDPDWNPSEMTKRPYDSSRALLALLLGARIVLSRDYYFWKLPENTLHGAFTRTRRGRPGELAIARHSSRATVDPKPVGEPLPEDAEAEQMIAKALLPRAGTHGDLLGVLWAEAYTRTGDAARAAEQALLHASLFTEEAA